MTTHRERLGKANRPRPIRAGVGFAVTFLAAWFTLDRLATAPPTPAASLGALAACAAVLGVGMAVAMGEPPARIARRLGLGRPAPRSVLAAAVVGAAVFVTYLVGAAVGHVPLELRSNWPAVLVGALIFNGVAEELVWRGFVFGFLRRRFPFPTALLLSMPLIALTHVPIILGNGWVVGGLAVATAAVTCVPLSYLWERGGRTIWASAVLHGLIDTWQLFERTYPAGFSIVLLAASILLPLGVLGLRDRFFGVPGQTAIEGTDAREELRR